MHIADIYVDPQVTGRMLGWVGAIFFAFCAVPQVIRTLKDGHAQNLSSLFLWMWFCGALLCAGGTLLDVGVVPWLLFNYVAQSLVRAGLAALQAVSKVRDFRTLPTERKT